MIWYVSALKRGLDFGGRSRRREFGLFYLVNSCVYLGIGLVIHWGGADEESAWPAMVLLVFALVMFPPGLALTVRRFHDTGHSGWWGLLLGIPFLNAFVALYLLVRDSRPGGNAYGPNPKE